MTPKKTNKCSNVCLTAKTPTCLFGSPAEKSPKIQSWPPSCVISSNVWGQKAYITNSCWPKRFAYAASAVLCCALWWAGIALGWQVLGTLFVGRYWWVWYQDYPSLQWLVLYPNAVVIQNEQGQIVHFEQPLTMVHLGVCCLLGCHVLCRDQMPTQYWRTLLVLARWPSAANS